MPERVAAEQRVLVLAPTGRDAAMISEMLTNSEFRCRICKDVNVLAVDIRTGAGLALVAEEALVSTPLDPLLETLSSQPAWSDFPLLFMTTSGIRPSETSIQLLKILGPEANVTILERPIQVATLLSGVQSAMRARRRQYQVRDYLQERERHKEELLQTQKLESLGVLAGGVAHDFNNLLTGILGNASLAIEALPEDCDDVRSALEDVISASERAAHLTKQLLAYAGKGKFVIEPLDLSEMARAVTHLVQSAVSKTAVLRLEIGGNLPTIEGDASQLQQIIMNLVINAAESIPAERNGQVFLTIRAIHLDDEYLQLQLPGSEIAAGEYVMLEVRDNGSGMSESTLRKIFDPFFTTKFTGRGLGLAAVQGIVRGHKGALKVETKEGEGTIFRVFFPSSTALLPTDSEQATANKQLSGEGVNVLVIDDEAMVRQTARMILERHGYKSVLACSGSEGIAMLEANSQSISLVLLDLTMPGMGGEEAFRRLRAIRPDIQIVLSSGFNETEVAQRFSGKGLAGFIQKPYTSGALAGLLIKVRQNRNVNESLQLAPDCL